MLDGEPEIEARTDYYKPYESHLDAILAKSLDTAKIFSEKDMDEASREFLNNNNNIEGLAFLPIINGGTNNGIIVLDKKTGEPVDFIKTSPWKYVKK
jgi:penicillin-binding protein-related factor A (putative recombinase)